jgi:aspartate aminotransferase
MQRSPHTTPDAAYQYRSSRIQSIAVSEILQIGARAQALQRSGKDIIVLAAGEPDFDTPDHIKAAATKAIDAGQTKYTSLEGSPSLRSAICDKLRRENGLVYSPPEVMVSSGAKQVIFNALAATLEPDDEVVLPAPYWTSYFDMIRFSGGVPKVVSCGKEAGFKLLPGALESAITPRTRWLILNSPSNPTGVGYRLKELEQLLAVLSRHPRILLLSDEIYEHIVYDQFEHVSPAAVAPALRSRTLVVNGASKAYAMTGWRIGWGAGPCQLIDAMAAVQSQVTSCASSVGQAAALAALVGPQNEISQRKEAFRGRRDVLVTALNQIPGVQCGIPDGAFYVFPNIEALIGKLTPDHVPLRSDVEITNYFLDIAHVALVPGSAFGMPGYCRISYAASTLQLQEACKRLSRAVRQLSRPAGIGGAK